MDKIIRRPPKMKLVGIERWSYLEPPKFKRILPPEIPGAISDWDFGSVPWQLDTSTYISAPSSLKLMNTGGALALLCKYTGTISISQGRIVTYAKASNDWGGAYAPGFVFIFRNQTALGSGPSLSSSYYLELDVYGPYVRIFRDGGLLGSTPGGHIPLISKPSSATQWNQYSVTWWTDPGGAGLMIRLEYWDGSQWVKMINDFNDPQDRYATSYLNRVGISQSYGTAWFDDTEIWSA